VLGFFFKVLGGGAPDNFLVATGASYGRWMVADAIVGRLLSLYASDDARVRDFHVRL
jgi:hypothetical protein